MNIRFRPFSSGMHSTPRGRLNRIFIQDKGVWDTPILEKRYVDILEIRSYPYMSAYHAYQDDFKLDPKSMNERAKS